MSHYSEKLLCAKASYAMVGGDRRLKGRADPAARPPSDDAGIRGRGTVDRQQKHRRNLGSVVHQNAGAIAGKVEDRTLHAQAAVPDGDPSGIERQRPRRMMAS